MKLFCTLIILIFVQNCSFDNKTGIWKNENSFSKEDNEIFKEFKTLSTSAKTYDKIVKLDKNFIFKLGNLINNFEWSDIYYNNTNNFDNLNLSLSFYLAVIPPPPEAKMRPTPIKRLRTLFLCQLQVCHSRKTADTDLFLK